MQVKVEKQTTVFLSLTEQEASELRAVVAFFPRGAVAITDVLYDELANVGIETDQETFDAVEKSTEERYL